MCSIKVLVTIHVMEKAMQNRHKALLSALQNTSNLKKIYFYAFIF